MPPTVHELLREAMRRKKMMHYAGHLEEMRRLGVKYVPLAFSSYGRAHPDAAAALETIARRAAQRRGLASHQQLLRRTQAAIGVLIWRRAAAMVHACLPRLSAEELALLFGGCR